MNIASKNFPRLDPKYFKAFIAVAEFGQFTLAAEKVAMTQSGVSQHVAKLEDQLGHPLFKRTGRRIILTQTGEKLLAFITRLNHSTAEFFHDINGIEEDIGGMVKCAMPPSCILSPQFSAMVEHCRKFPRLELQLELCTNKRVLENVLKNNCDFGFVSEKFEHSALQYLPFCREECILVASDRALVTALSADNLLQQNFIFYPDMEGYFNYWRSHFMPKLEYVDARSIHHAGGINSVEGASIMVVNGLGIGVFPRHCVQQFIEAGALHEFSKVGIPPLFNSIYIVQLNSHGQSSDVTKTIERLMERTAA